MGYRDSSAQLGGHSEVFGHRERVAEAIAAGEPGGSAARESAGELNALGVKERAPSAGARALLLLVRFYIVFLSPFFGGACKFYPSCSNYAAEAIARHGAPRGVALAIRRLLRCHPFTRGGVDFVPEAAIGEAGTPQAKILGSPQGHQEPVQ